MSHVLYVYDWLSVVEDLSKRREPLPSLEAVYLLMPTSAVSHVSDIESDKLHCDDQAKLYYCIFTMLLLAVLMDVYPIQLSGSGHISTIWQNLPLAGLHVSRWIRYRH